MKKSYIAGIFLFVIAAFFSLSLLLVLFDFGGMSAAHNSFFFGLGKFFTNAYGACSVFIPIFLIVAASHCFIAKWHFRTGVLLSGSVIPFFTLVGIEKICRFFARSESGDLSGAKIFVTILIGLMVVALEFLILSILGDMIERKLLDRHIDEDSERPLDIDEDSVVVPVYSSNSEIQIIEQTPEPSVYAPQTEDAPKSEPEPVQEKARELPQSEKRTPAYIGKLLHDSIQEQNAHNNDFISFDNLANDVDRLDLSGKKNPYASIFDEAEKKKSEEEAKEKAQVAAEARKKALEEKSEPILAPVDGIVFDDDFDDDDTIEPDTVSEDEISEPEEDVVSPELENNSEPEEDVISTSSMTADDETMSAGEETMSASDDAIAADDEAVTADEAENVATREADDSEPESEDSGISTSSMTADDETMSASDEAVAADDEAVAENEAEEPCPEVRVNFSNASVINDNGEQFEIETEVAKEDRNFHIETEDTADAQWQGQTKSEPEESDISTGSMSAGEETMSADGETMSAGDETMSDDDETISASDESEDSDISTSSMSDDDEPVTADEAEDSFSKPLGFENYSAGDDKIDVNIVDDGIDYDDDFEEDVVSESEIETPRTNDYQLTQNEAETESDIEIESDSPAAQNLAVPQSVDTQEEVPPRHTAPVHSWANYAVPTDLLEEYPNNEYWIIDEDTKLAATKLMKTLAEFKIEAEVTGICKGPVVTMFEILPAPGVKLSKIVALQDNIALTLAASSVRIVAPIPGKHAVGIEVPNKNRAIVSFREIIDEDFAAFTKMGIPVVLGKDISGEPQIIDIAKTPHLLIAGSTGAGKSVCVNSILLSILFKRSPAQVKLILVDPKIVELSLYNDIPHLLTPVITEPKRALQALQYCLCEMERRYALLSGMSVRDIISYNYKIQAEHIAAEKLPYIVVIIDEFADLMMTTGKELETSIARLAAKSRAVGIHLVLATQRPSIDVITGLIKANLPSRIAFMVASKMDSRIIIDQGGAEKLLGKGDMLYSGSTSPYPVRIQGTLVSDEEVENVVDYVKSFGEPDYIDDEMFIDDEEEDSDNGTMFHEDGTDPLYDQALEIVIQAGKASASYIQRKLSIGYNRAARLVEEMEERGIVGPANGSKPREIIHLP